MIESKKRELTILKIVGLLSVIMLVVVVVVPISALLLPTSYAQQQQNTIDSAAPCVTYDSTDKIITIICNSASLTDVDKQLKDANILYRETTDEDSNYRIWLLNAGIVVADKATLYINSTDTSWLKINADGDTEHIIEVYGNLKIDSVKITSWNPKTNDYAKIPAYDEDKEPELIP